MAVRKKSTGPTNGETTIGDVLLFLIALAVILFGGLELGNAVLENRQTGPAVEYSHGR